MLDTDDFNKSSNLSSHTRSTDGEHSSKCWTLGELKDALKRLNASWELTRQNLTHARVRSAHRLDQASSNVLPGSIGAPNRLDSSTSTRLNEASTGSATTVLESIVGIRNKAHSGALLCYFVDVLRHHLHGTAKYDIVLLANCEIRKENY